MKIFNVLTEPEVQKFVDSISESDWDDGSLSVSLKSSKKLNRQIGSNTNTFKTIAPFIQKSLLQDDVKAYTFMRRAIDPRLASYRTHGKYDFHVDVALLANDRTDLSFTIFLNSPDEYEGGELEIVHGTESTSQIKGQKGQMVVYPSGSLHRVRPITSGERLVVVGWINSHVKSEEHRERLWNYRNLLVSVQPKLTETELEQFTALYHQMVRDYSS